LSSILEVERLSVDYRTPYEVVHALRDVSFEVKRGEVLSIVGESGCGKSTIALTVSKLLPASNARIRSGRVLFRGADILRTSKPEMNSIRGTGIFMIFQNPFMSLNPLMKVKDQMAEAIRVRSRRSRSEASKEEAEKEIASTLRSVRIGDAEDVMERYPHQLSGGQNQRVMFAMALAEKPDLLIADEPTTALDVTTQAQVLALLREIIRETGMSVIFITHDLLVAASVSDRIAVLYGGMIQEVGPSRQILTGSKHPYTAGLIQSIPSGTKDDGPLAAIKGVFSLEGVGKACAFAPRCPLARDACWKGVPALTRMEERSVRCVNYGEAYEQ
jgi:peptide/nickel transport system ATP-binding protein